MAKEAQRFAEIAAQAVHDSRQDYHQLAASFGEAQGALNDGLGIVHKRHVHRYWDRTANETEYLRKDLCLLQKIMNEEDTHGRSL